MTDTEGPLEHEVRAEVAEGLSPQRPIRHWLRRRHAFVRTHPTIRPIYLVFVAVVGLVMVIGGLILVPLPGPGWLIVFIGLAVLSTEFIWAKRLTTWARAQLNRFWAWWHRVRKSTDRSK